MADLEIKPSARARGRVLVVMLIAGSIGLTLVYLLLGASGTLFAPTTTLSTFMPDATGLDVDSDVRLSGIRIGAVTRIKLSGLLDPQRAVQVEMRVKERFLRNIPQDSETSIRADTLIGNNFVSIEEGKSPLPTEENGTLRSELLKQQGDRADLMLALQHELQQVDSLLEQISSGKTTIGRFLTSEDDYDTVLQLVQSFEQSMRSFVVASNPAGQALFSSALYDRIRGPLMRVDQQLAAIQRGEGGPGQIFSSDHQYEQFLEELGDLRKALANLSPALFRDESGYQNIRKMLDATDALISSLDAGQGEVGNLFRNPQLYESLNGSLRSMQELLRDLQQNPRKYLRYKVF